MSSQKELSSLQIDDSSSWLYTNYVLQIFTCNAQEPFWLGITDEISYFFSYRYKSRRLSATW